MRGFVARYLGGTALLSVAVSAPAWAQTAAGTAAPPPSAATAAAHPLDDIVVTARRRDEGLSRTPVSVAVLSGDKLHTANIVNEYDLRAATPGLSVRAGQNTQQLNFALRGNTQDPYSDSRPGVLPYFNEVQIGGQAGATAFYDLQSIQVLKGPQGTLFGRSATGGAVLYTTAKPTDQFGGYVSGLYGNFNQYKLEGAINLPLSGDQLMFRLAGFYRGQDGYQHNIYPGGDPVLGDQRQWGIRPSLTAKFGPSIRSDIVVDYFHSTSENVIGVISGLLPYTGKGAPFIPLQYLYAGVSTPAATLTGECALQGFAGLGACPPVTAAVANYYQSFFANPAHPDSIATVLAQQNARGPYIVDSDLKDRGDAYITNLSDTTTFDVSDGVQIKNIFGYSRSIGRDFHDGDGTPFSISGSGTLPDSSGHNQFYRSYSNEFQILGKTSRFDYVLGLYYSEENTHYLYTSAFFDILFGGSFQVNDTIQTNKTRAAYGQVTYHLNDNGLSFTLGGRYTSEKVGKIVGPMDSIRAALGSVPPAGFSYDKSRTFNKPSWTIGLQDQVSSSLLLYAASRRAYKSGGFNAQLQPKDGPASIGGDSYEAERVTDAELGAKFNGMVGSTPVRASVALYNNWIRNSQRAAFALVDGSPSALTVNVPKGKTYGAEFDVSARLTKWLTLGGAGNYTHATFARDPVVVNGDLQVFDQVPDTPRYSASPYVDIDIPLRQDLKLITHADIYYQSRTTISPRSANFAGTEINGYVLTNFRLGVRNEEQGWSLIANVKNAFNRTFYIGGLQAGEIYQVNTLVPGEPRSFTVEARFNF